MTTFSRTLINLGVACAFALAGTGTKSQTIAPLRVGSASVSTLNYARSNAGYWGLGNLILEPLLVLTKDGKMGPWLAESWTQPNPTTYVYKLRKGVRFSSGNELTAADVAFSLNFYREPGSTNAYNFPATLKSITAVDRYTVQVSLSEPDAAWAVAPAGPQLGIFEKAFYEQHESSFGQPETGVVGTGPWQLSSFNPTSGAELTVNPHYWGGSVPIQSISWKFFSSESSEALAFRAGDLDVAFPSDRRSFAATSGVDLKTAPGVTNQAQFTMNTLVAPWDDVHLRRAVAYALDKPALISAYGGYAQPVNTLIPPTMLLQLGSQEEVDAALASIPDYPHDLGKAKEEMAKSAYPGGVDVTLAVYNTPSYVNVSQAIVPQLAAIGIRAELKVVQDAAWVAEATGDDRKAIHAQFWTNGAVSPDPGGANDSIIGSRNATAGNWNVSNWSSAEVDDLIARGRATTDPAKRLQIYQLLLTKFAENVPFVPLFLTDEAVALSSNYSWSSFDSYWNQHGPWALELEIKQ
ncbi:ABC transporter substrate-binding protein [Mesorhizobium sp.]|uniref:ABC transporter substrate-binding protein n=1 Tax=Mesorhizobium sp. TaxID=1871066 RepID=UPI00257B880D|nr:ABC transporter substrate-binding protein [Mesorhizobium sp.]